MDRSFEPLTDNEQKWLQEQLRNAATFCGLEHSALPTVEALDEAWNQFIALGDCAIPKANDVVLCVGVALGEHLVRSHGFAWVIATDEFGTDLAVLARPGRGDITVCPTDFVTKRWESKESRFVAKSIEEIDATVKRITNEWGDNA